MPRSLFAVVTGLLLAGCMTADQTLTGMHQDMLAVYPNLDPTLKAFFANEAATAGVWQIRRMSIGETPKRWSKRQSGCAQALFAERLILINPTRERCLELDHLAHEIAHIGVLRTHCYGHGDRFYDYNRGIAMRFERAFPDNSDRGGWRDPVGSVDRRAKRYREGAERCL